ncbi:methyltransferase domain-containing protein [Streptomyces sp. NPDC059452]|uniref:methyltransferase domain-containing protein n=1 Tax=Streptomyces sp. NPDC059452 TaxID=3346835 RepID=UPI0036AAEDBD
MRETSHAAERLLSAMDRAGAWPARSPWIRQAAAALPREQFAPQRIWHWNGHDYTPVDHRLDPDRWDAIVYPGPDEPTVTHIIDGVPTSSLSCEAIVADMLDSLLLEEGHRTLELGTGSGRNAALLAYQAGPGRVITVEVDEELAASARRVLREARAEVIVQVGDGGAGCPADAPFDRVISTYAVDPVPWAWVAQTRPGGRIVTPWGRLGHVALTVAPDGKSASGWMQGLAQFMPSRATRAEPAWREIREQCEAHGERHFVRDIALLRTHAHLRFALRVAVPDLRIATAPDVDADGVNAWLHDGVSSWATLSAQEDGRTTAHQGGPRNLADELEQAWQRWLDAGQPELYDFGMTVEPARQTVWCEKPEAVWRTTDTAP